MSSITAPSASNKTEFQKVLRMEFFRRPWLARCSVLAIAGYFGGLFVNYLCQGRLSSPEREFLVAAIHGLGAAAGVAGYLIASPTVRRHLPLLWGAAIGNGIFALLFLYRAVVFLRLPHS